VLVASEVLALGVVLVASEVLDLVGAALDDELPPQPASTTKALRVTSPAKLRMLPPMRRTNL
jgi:hypothetical protein